MVDTLPRTIAIDVRDYLARVAAGSEFDLLGAQHTTHIAARLDVPYDCSGLVHLLAPMDRS
jgi:hypothetical protein